MTKSKLTVSQKRQSEIELEKRINDQYDVIQKEEDELFLSQANVEDIEASVRRHKQWIREMENELKNQK